MYYEAIDYWNSSNSYLEHYGVKGMKWGVRKVIEAPARHFRAKDVAERLNAVSKDRDRMAGMSQRQKRSLKNAQEYWNARAAGKSNLPKRNFIKREADRYRSYSLGTRAAVQGVRNTIRATRNAVQSNRQVEELGGEYMGMKLRKYGVGDVAVSSLTGTGISLGSDWVVNRLFGHF